MTGRTRSWWKKEEIWSFCLGKISLGIFLRWLKRHRPRFVKLRLMSEMSDTSFFDLFYGQFTIAVGHKLSLHSFLRISEFCQYLLHSNVELPTLLHQQCFVPYLERLYCRVCYYVLPSSLSSLHENFSKALPCYDNSLVWCRRENEVSSPRSRGYQSIRCDGHT